MGGVGSGLRGGKRELERREREGELPPGPTMKYYWVNQLLFQKQWDVIRGVYDGLPVEEVSETWPYALYANGCVAAKLSCVKPYTRTTSRGKAGEASRETGEESGPVEIMVRVANYQRGPSRPPQWVTLPGKAGNLAAAKRMVRDVLKANPLWAPRIERGKLAPASDE